MSLTAKQKKWFEYMALMLELHHDNGVRFDLRSWVSLDADDPHGAADWCGTKGCACGLASFNPTFQQAGFTNNAYEVTFDEFDGWDAVREFFRVSQKQAEYLFSASSYRGQTYGDRGARAVARRIRKFIQTNGAVPKSFYPTLSE